MLAAKKIIWLRGLLASLGFNQHKPTQLFTDSTAAIDMVTNHKTSNKSEHLTLQINFVRQLIENGTIALVHVDTDNNMADLMTKNLARGKFIPHKATLLHGHGGKYPSSKVLKRIAVPNPFTKMQALRRKADRAKFFATKRTEHNSSLLSGPTSSSLQSGPSSSSLQSGPSKRN